MVRQKGKTTVEVVNQELLDKCNLELQADIIDNILEKFNEKSTINVTAQELWALVQEMFNFKGTKSCPFDFFIALVHNFLTMKNACTIDQKNRFLESFVKDYKTFGLNEVELQEFLEDIAPLLIDFALQTIDPKTSAYVVVHQIEDASQVIAKRAGLNEERKRSLLAQLFAALMLSDKFTLVQKDQIFEEMHKSYGHFYIVHQAKYILKVIKQYRLATHEYVSIKSPMITESGITTTLLHLATIKINSNPQFFKQLLQLGADVNAVDSLLSRTPLYNALAMGSRDAVKLLLKHGARVDVRDNNNQTPLHMFFINLSQYALMEEVIEIIIDELLAHNPPLNVKDNNGKTPLQLWRNVAGLSAEFKAKIEQLLIEKGAD